MATIDDTTAASRGLLERAIDELAQIPEETQSHQEHGEAQTAIGELCVVLKALNEQQPSADMTADLSQIAVRLAPFKNPHTCTAREIIEAVCTLPHRYD